MQHGKTAQPAAGSCPRHWRGRVLLWGSAFALGLVAPLAQAVEYEPFHVGTIEVIPDFNTKLTPTGSVLLPNGEEESANLLLFRPRIKAQVNGEGRQFSSTMEVQNGIYSVAGAADYLDWKLENVARFDLDGRRRLKFRTENFNTHEGAGSTSLAEAKRDPVRYQTSTFDMDYEQSLWGRRGQLVLGAGTFEKSYVSAAATPDIRDHQDSHSSGSFRLRVLPGTDLQLQYRARDIDYLGEAADGAPVDRREVFTYVGASWEPDIAGAGKLRIDSGYKQTDNGTGRVLADTTAWETKLRWQPLAESTLTLATDRTLRQRLGLGARDSTSSYRYNWEQRWASQLKTTLAGSYSRNVNGTTQRENKGLGVKLRLDYAYSTWVNMFVAFGHDRREIAGRRGFSQQNVMLGIAASLDSLFGR